MGCNLPGLRRPAVLVIISGAMVSLRSHHQSLTCHANHLQFFIAWMAGARFDLMFNQLKKGVFLPPKTAEQTANAKQAFEHGELLARRCSLLNLALYITCNYSHMVSRQDKNLDSWSVNMNVPADHANALSSVY